MHQWLIVNTLLIRCWELMAYIEFYLSWALGWILLHADPCIGMNSQSIMHDDNPDIPGNMILGLKQYTVVYMEHWLIICGWLCVLNYFHAHNSLCTCYFRSHWLIVFGHIYVYLCVFMYMYTIINKDYYEGLLLNPLRALIAQYVRIRAITRSRSHHNKWNIHT